MKQKINVLQMPNDHSSQNFVPYNMMGEESFNCFINIFNKLVSSIRSHVHIPPSKMTQLNENIDT